MPRTLHKLSATAVVAIATPGYHADGGGLYLRVAPGGTRGWIFRFTIGGKTRDAGLGSYPAVSLAKARAAAAKSRELVSSGVDPIVARKSEREAALSATMKTLTFRDCALAVIASHEAGWRNSKHRQQWANTLKTYAYPQIGDWPVGSIDTALVMRVLDPIWRTKPETASRVRGRIETVLDWARVGGYRQSEANPARWRGHLDQLLPQKQKVRHVRHHPALPYARVPGFMAELGKREGVAERALEFGILTATRSSEFRTAQWRDIVFEEAVWTARVKITSANPSGEFRVPLSDAALAVLSGLPQIGRYVFPGQRADSPISDSAIRTFVLRAMGYGAADCTIHGFRSSFRDWAAERTSFPNHVVEKALAHAVSSAVEAAYRRGDLFDKRRKLMDAWAAWCARMPASAAVLPLQRRG
jgi:integrase